MSDQTYSVDPGKPQGGGDNGAPLANMPITRHGDDFVADHTKDDQASTTQPAGQGS